MRDNDRAPVCDVFHYVFILPPLLRLAATDAVGPPGATNVRPEGPHHPMITSSTTIPICKCY